MAEFEIESGIEMPKAKSTGKEKYPFGKLEVGQSFFVADSQVFSGDAQKTMLSAVSSAHQRYSEEDPSGEMREVKRGDNKGQMVPKMNRLRTFTVRIDTKDGAAGCRVFRTA